MIKEHKKAVYLERLAKEEREQKAIERKENSIFTKIKKVLGK